MEQNSWSSIAVYVPTPEKAQEFYGSCGRFPLQHATHHRGTPWEFCRRLLSDTQSHASEGLLGSRNARGVHGVDHRFAGPDKEKSCGKTGVPPEELRERHVCCRLRSTEELTDPSCPQRQDL